jgi:hypothetical protein
MSRINAIWGQMARKGEIFTSRLIPEILVKKGAGGDSDFPTSAPKVAHVDRGLFSLFRCMQASPIKFRGVADIILYYILLLTI